MSLQRFTTAMSFASPSMDGSLRTRASHAARGFTLIELVVVLVILGILAAFAIPRFINIATDARTSSINGVAGTMRSTASLVHGLALAHNNTGATGTETLEGAAVATVYGYPAASATGIVLAMNNLDTNAYGLVPGTGTITITVLGASTPANCSVMYTEPTAAGTPGVVSPPDTSKC